MRGRPATDASIADCLGYLMLLSRLSSSGSDILQFKTLVSISPILIRRVCKNTGVRSAVAKGYKHEGHGHREGHEEQ
jgi:hypothetical protein